MDFSLSKTCLLGIRNELMHVPQEWTLPCYRLFLDQYLNKFRMLIRWLSHSNSISSSSLFSFVVSFRFVFKLLRVIYQEIALRRIAFSIIDGGYTFLSYIVFFSLTVIMFSHAFLKKQFRQFRTVVGRIRTNNRPEGRQPTELQPIRHRFRPGSMT